MNDLTDDVENNVDSSMTTIGKFLTTVQNNTMRLISYCVSQNLMNKQLWTEYDNLPEL
jgi:hypothetical protein